MKQLLGALSPSTGMAFVLIQHLDPKHESLSAEILSRTTSMPVKEVANGMIPKPDHVYIIPPNAGLRISGGALRIVPRDQGRGQHLVIDTFLESLAEERGRFAIGVILSGTGSDGTQGLGAIKAAGGLTFVQEPKSARFDGMPQAAIKSGNVDLVLPLDELANELRRIAIHFRGLAAREPEPEAHEEPLSKQGPLAQILRLLKEQCHVDFSEYKSSTIARRIERRMVLKRAKTIGDFAKLLQSDASEVQALFADILIHVTGFFRDPPAFDALKDEVFPKILSEMERRNSEVGIRIWVPGCSTGEEVYSIAISLLEFLGKRASYVPIQIFGSDISERAIQRARIGEYPELISKSVSPERLNRFFVKLDGGGYRIGKSVRDLCLFSRHNAVQDPPFAKLDLISCRNLLIYFSPALQKKVVSFFHYALNPGGFLWLGMSETINESPGLFSIIDRVHKIYEREAVAGLPNLRFPANTYLPAAPELTRKSPDVKGLTDDLQAEIDRRLQSEFPGVLINDDMEILQFRGRTFPFLEPPTGTPVHQLIKMARPELHSELRLAIQAARKRDVPVRRTGISIRDGRAVISLNLRVVPLLAMHDRKSRRYLVIFEKVTEAKGMKGGKKGGGAARKGSRMDPYVADLQHRFNTLQEDQAALIKKFEAAHEDATAANEELQSANEELQSTNEELETAKEELQSGNEELSTVNDELQSRNVEQNQLNNDLTNLLGSVEIPILMLDHGHRIRRFTPLAAKVLNLIASDVGRPIEELKLTFTAPGMALDLGEVVAEVARTGTLKEIEVQDREGHWFRLQARPYRTTEGKPDGAVLSFVDVNALKRSLTELKSAKNEAEQANRAKDLFLATLSHELRTPLTAILSWSQMLKAGLLDSEKVKRAAVMIEESGRAQAQLINDLLDVSRIITGKLALELREIDLPSVIQAAIDSVRPIAEARRIEIVTDLASKADVGIVRADPARLQQVFLNLLTNAIKFSAPNAQVWVRLDRLEPDGSHFTRARVQVRDVGKGINPEFIPRLFDRFSQEDSSSMRLHGGLGLGLAIVRNLVELQGGSVHAESPGEGKGATFTVLLPVVATAGAPGVRSGSKTPLPIKSSRPGNEFSRIDGARVLIVDDDFRAGEAFLEILASAGAEVKVAHSVREALEIFGQFKPQVLLTDIAMPGEDGYALLRRIRMIRSADGGDVPCIAVTAYASDEDRRRALSAGFEDHLGKPVDAGILIETVARHAPGGGKLLLAR